MNPVKSAASANATPASCRHPVLFLLCVALLAALVAVPALAAQAPQLVHEVEVRRTSYGIPHIAADNLRAAGYGLGYVQLEDYGDRVVRGLIRARGELSMHLGPDHVQEDADSRRRYARARETYHLLHQDTRDVLEGFAAGVNRYVQLHPSEMERWGRVLFTGMDVHALGIGTPGQRTVRQFQARMARDARQPIGEQIHPDDGSNSWALAPSRTTSGHAILVRNPHLSWDAGYYEAQITVPGVLNYYGDFRIGGPLGIIGGFNDRLGWSTSNNNPHLDEVYALRADPDRADHYLLDGESHPLEREDVRIEYRDGDGVGHTYRTSWRTSLGPVIHRDGERVYIIRSADDGQFRMGEQFLRMMQAQNLEEWKEAMRIRGRTASNFTYADAEGNIFYVWNATLPALPHRSGGHTRATPVSRSSDVWTEIVPFDSLPQLLNPPGGYIRNENDPFHFTNLHAPLDGSGLPDNVPAPRLSLRSQHSLELLHNERRFSLEDVVELKHSMRMTLADRVKPYLVRAVRASEPEGEVLRALRLLQAWDNSVAAGSRGGVLFETWWDRYRELLDGEEPYRHPWSEDEPVHTPRGLSEPHIAAEAFVDAVAETRRRHGSWDVAWGDVHRVRHGDVDLPVGGCSGALGCFRVLGFREAEDGRRVVQRGDGWVLAVEFGDTPRAYSVLAYGQSAREGSPHHTDQVRMFAENRMKAVAFTEEDIEARLIRRYRPGLTAP